MKIDQRAVVSPEAELGEGVSVGPFTIIEDDVVVGPGTQIASGIVIASGTRIGEECQIHHGAVLGTLPQDYKFKGEDTILEIGDRTVVREYCTLNRGTADRGKTLVGNDCFLMAYVHVAHDCWIGNEVILANAVNMAGHVTIEDFAGVGGIVPIHQFVRVGRYAFIGGGYRVPKDVPPYILAAGEPLRFAGVNVIGLRRRGFDSETLLQLRQAYKYIYKSNLNVSQAVKKIEEEMNPIPEVKEVIDFIKRSERGIIK